mmetsp:Transcript_95467/g.275650  ORF Transcript_95467/g.275650 Transcript_95467/m.275650 type:complete len:112 (+) Transcript_95467:81-416(+)
MGKDDPVDKLEARVSSMEQRVGNVETKLDNILKVLAGAGPSLSTLKSPGGLFSRPAAANLPPEHTGNESEDPATDMEISPAVPDPDPPTAPDIALAKRASQRSQLSMSAAA